MRKERRRVFTTFLNSCPFLDRSSSMHCFISALSSVAVIDIYKIPISPLKL